jgi:hypothetical protein
MPKIPTPEGMGIGPSKAATRLKGCHAGRYGRVWQARLITGRALVQQAVLCGAMLYQPRAAILAEPSAVAVLVLAPRAPHGGAPYGITSVTWSMISLGKVIPSAWAVFKFTTNSNSRGCSTGRSAGFAPLRIRST